MKNHHPFLALAGVKSPEEFYSKFPTEQHFFKAYPMAKFQMGGGINKGNWNNFQTWMQNKGYAGNPQMNRANFRSDQILNQYNQQYPQQQVPQSMVPAVQEDFLNTPGHYGRTAPLSKKDNFVGSVTSTYRYPDAAPDPATVPPVQPPKPIRKVRYEKQYDNQGRKLLSPVFDGRWSQKDVEEFYKTIPQNFGDVRVLNFAEWKEGMKGFGQNTWSDQWQPTTDPTRISNVPSPWKPKQQYGGFLPKAQMGVNNMNANDPMQYQPMQSMQPMGYNQMPGMPQVEPNLNPVQMGDFNAYQKKQYPTATWGQVADGAMELGTGMANVADYFMNQASNKRMRSKQRERGLSDNLFPAQPGGDRGGTGPQGNFSYQGMYQMGGLLPTPLSMATDSYLPEQNMASQIQPSPINSESFLKQVSNPGVPSENPPKLKGKARERTQYVMNYFAQQGLDPQTSAAITSNLVQESGHFDPNVISGKRRGDQGSAFGVAQWRADRQKNFFEWAKNKQKDPYDLHTQLDFVLFEAKQRGDLKATQAAGNPHDAAYIFGKKYERPAVVEPVRMAMAEKLFSGKFQNGGYVPGQEVEMNPKQLQQFLKMGGQVEYV